MKKGIKLTICLIVTIIVAVAGLFAYNYYYDRKVANFNKETSLFVYPDTEAQTVIDYIIDSCGVLNKKSVIRAFNKQKEYGAALCPGHYRISSNSTSVYVARMVYNGWQTPVDLVLSGTMRRQEGLAKKISAQLMLDSLDVITALRDSALLAKYGFTPANVFALLIPDTYEVYWTDSMEAVFDKQKKAYDSYWTDDNIAKAQKLGLSKIQVSILASIVKGETNYVPEMSKIAGVYLTRLKKGMKLQADPTVAFCLNYEVDRILNKHLKIDSPYNTYENVGLPPTPISVPTKDCLNAVLNPDMQGYLFFCASPDFNGTHRFAKTYTEHLRNARAFQRELNKRRAAKN